MKNLLLLLLPLFTFIIPVQCLPMKSDDSHSQCPKIGSDESVVTQKDFNIPLNPHHSHTKSRGFRDADNRIYHLAILKERVIPSQIFGLTKLEQLEVQRTCFYPCDETTIPSNIQCLASLKELAIYNTKITHLPDTIGELKNLTTLILSNTGLQSVPDTIGDLGSLTLLDLDGNQLTSLPESIRQLKSLQSLTLSKNPHLRSIEVISNFLPSLATLDTQYCPIETLPQNLPQLRTLFMTNNTLEQLIGIETLGNGTNNPKEFYFSNNLIRVITPSIDQVRMLRTLILDNNPISTLPSNIYKISTLQCLSVAGRNSINWFELKDISKFFKCD